ncbi:UNVERIFIED_CONTAM: hypothetical protein OHV15_04660 [Microbacterium sp. SLM126]
MTSPTKLLAVAGFGLAVALAGCTPAPPEAEPTPTFSSEAEAFAAAEATYREYVKALNAVDLSDPETFEGVYAWTTGDLNASDRKGLSGYHAVGASVSGQSEIRSAAPATGATLNDIQLAVCLDVSEVRVVDSSGASLVDDDRTDVQSLTVIFAEAPASPTRLVLESIGPRDGGPNCTL